MDEKNINFNSQVLFIIQQNFNLLEQQFLQIQKLIEKEFQEQNDLTLQINLIIFIISICFVVIFLYLAIKPYKQYILNIQSILMVIGRVNEQETNEEIQKLKLTKNLIESENEIQNFQIWEKI
ncbi:hypothetical protein IMG5_062520 [Ichthyophthirius multifiliis]|uniref:Transmembrane protein n=1 Tax=Ichthyophthirius multifiliis TaxID=5932 RepID=G0QNY7_ICHMU|nr:hypothetical protein IMG5_062520 [Ichthyophthirius multifiliis]EGR33074.1 hypothetical protein IMG5_062520 [Ichthyophthirius multifiliis]|eukprot:XP_004037060.1 hypothetical protein IMG5_062520 [Ichthyophthirius multifiliis]